MIYSYKYSFIEGEAIYQVGILSSDGDFTDFFEVENLYQAMEYIAYLNGGAKPDSWDRVFPE